MKHYSFLIILTFLFFHDIDGSKMVVPMNNLYTANIATRDLVTFTKVGGAAYSYSTVITTYPIPQNATTTFTIKIISTSNLIVLGCGKKNTDQLWSTYMGQTATTLGFFAANGYKFLNNLGLNYGAALSTGDLLSIKINLNPQKMNAQFFKNGVSMGVAYGGLGDWGDIYIGISLGQDGASVTITDYTVNS